MDAADIGYAVGPISILTPIPIMLMGPTLDRSAEGTRPVAIASTAEENASFVETVASTIVETAISDRGHEVKLYMRRKDITNTWPNTTENIGLVSHTDNIPQKGNILHLYIL